MISFYLVALSTWSSSSWTPLSIAVATLSCLLVCSPFPLTAIIQLSMRSGRDEAAFILPSIYFDPFEWNWMNLEWRINRHPHLSSSRTSTSPTCTEVSKLANISLASKSPFFRHFLRKISLGGDDGRNICQATFYATKNYRKLIAHFFIHLPAMTGESETKQTVSAFRLSFIISG